jgi:signal transduction histidine kinase
MLNTVFRNLISNSIKFTSKGGQIEIGVSDSGRNFPCQLPSDSSYNCIYVKDNGIGMSKELMNKLFRLDQKVSRPGTEGEPSTGLGLLLRKEFVEKHGGKIWVESEENNGSTFYFTLP